MDNASNRVEEIAKRLPQLCKIYQYNFSAEITNLISPNKGWQKTIKRDVEIIYLGRKEGLHFYQVLTIKINLSSNKTFPNLPLLKKIVYIFDYIEVGTNNKGLIQKIFNIADLKLRMQKIKTLLEIDNTGVAFMKLFESISELLQNEKKLIQFLESYKMFGLYFNGLNKSYQEAKAKSIIKTRVLDDLDQIQVQEEITCTESNNNLHFTVNKISKEQQIIKYNGLYKNEYNQLTIGFMEIETEEKNIKYNVSWVG